MDIQVGDKITYKSLGEMRIALISDNEDIDKIQEDIKNNNIEILKIERPKYEVVEEKKELLTEEEKEFLRIFNKIEKNKIKEVGISDSGNLCITDNRIFTYFIDTDKFQNLEKNKSYTLKELGLEEN